MPISVAAVLGCSTHGVYGVSGRQMAETFDPNLVVFRKVSLEQTSLRDIFPRETCFHALWACGSGPRSPPWLPEVLWGPGLPLFAFSKTSFLLSFS